MFVRKRQVVEGGDRRWALPKGGDDSTVPQQEVERVRLHGRTDLTCSKNKVREEWEAEEAGWRVQDRTG